MPFVWDVGAYWLLFIVFNPDCLFDWSCSGTCMGAIWLADGTLVSWESLCSSLMAEWPVLIAFCGVRISDLVISPSNWCFDRLLEPRPEATLFTEGLVLKITLWCPTLTRFYMFDLLSRISRASLWTESLPLTIPSFIFLIESSYISISISFWSYTFWAILWVFWVPLWIFL